MRHWTPAPVICYDTKDRARRLEVMHWGLVPYWTKDIKNRNQAVIKRTASDRSARSLDALSSEITSRSRPVRPEF